MIKTCVATGLKYLCYTVTEGKQYATYKGSGTYWNKHLKKHGDAITTVLIFETSDKHEFKEFAIKKSNEFNVVKSADWANLRIEQGDGGSTSVNKIWITDGAVDKYIFKDDSIPAGWARGRTNCVFNNPLKQKEFGKIADPKKRGLRIKKAWDDGKFDKRDNSKLGYSGKDNVACRPEVRAKIKKAALSQSEERSKRMKRNKVWEKSNRWKTEK